MANMFSGNTEKRIPKDLKECYLTDKTTQNLWLWCERLESWGKFLFWFIIVSGVIVSIASSIVVRDIPREVYYYLDADTETSFDFVIFLTSIIETIMYAFIEYCVYHVLALLISSLAMIVQNTKITANISLYSVAKEEGLLTEESKMGTANKQSTGFSLSKWVDRGTTNIGGPWICKECDTKNDGTNVYCKTCGKYK